MPRCINIQRERERERERERHTHTHTEIRLRGRQTENMFIGGDKLLIIQFLGGKTEMLPNVCISEAHCVGND